MIGLVVAVVLLVVAIVGVVVWDRAVAWKVRREDEAERMRLEMRRYVRH